MANLGPAPKAQFFDSNGDPLVGGKVYTYQAGTSTPLATYTSSAGTSANTNPVILDARGEANIWFGAGLYKIILKTSADVEIWTVDNVSGTISSVSPQFSGNVVISSDSADPALRVTQVGSGLVARFEDSTYPDATPTVIDNSGRVGIGTSTPTAALDVADGVIQQSSSSVPLTSITAVAGDTTINANGSRSLKFQTASVDRIIITSGGLIGVGKTPSLGIALDVNGVTSATYAQGTSGVITDAITEYTTNAGVTVDGTLIKDAHFYGSAQISTLTSQATTSGTSFTFNNIPSWACAIHVIFYDVSLSGTDDFLVQIGPDSTPTATGYLSASSTLAAAVSTVASTTGFIINRGGAAANSLHGILTIRLEDPTSFNYASSHNGRSLNTTPTTCTGGGGVVLSALAGCVKLLATGSNTFDGGAVNVSYE